ncbi:acetoin reductase [Pseudogracilibacillus sp. SE30717A]|uniref:acetoin reductase n=1 Tax=Pseudogracilibacillus sp. SE30717A TaxID=3098293 RepID=UPI00300E6C13
MSNKIAIITGAAQGIGKAIAYQLAKDGFIPILCDINEEKLLATELELKKAGYHCASYKMNVEDRQEVFHVVERVVKEYKQIDVMVANAGIVQVKPLIEITEADMRKIFNVNVFGMLYCIQAASKYMIKQKRGKIINASSTSGKRAVELLGHYAATKFAVIGLTQAAAKELAPHGITVNAYCPGIVGTSMWEEIDKQMSKRLKVKEGETFQQKINNIPIGRVEEPEDVAGLVSYLASDKSDYMTGQALVIDGGNVFS